MNDIIKKIHSKNRIQRIIMMIISLVLSAVVYNTFLLPMSLVTGGTGGIATITYYLYEIDPSIMIFAITAACALMGFMYLGKERTIGSILISFSYPLLVKLTSFLNNTIEIDPENILIIVIFAGVLSGIANGIMYRTGYSNGGLPIISQVLFKTKKIAISKSSLVMNIIIVGIGAFFFGTTNALYAVIFLYINNLVLDKVLLGISNNKAFYIITDEEDKVKEYIIEHLGHAVTIFDVKGGFFNQKRRVILTVIPSREYYKVTEGIKEIDKDAFFVVTDAYQVEGAK